MGASALPHHGLRVVTGQRLTQSASDGFLGWTEEPTSGRQYYVSSCGTPRVQEMRNSWTRSG